MFEQSVKKYLQNYKSNATWSEDDGYVLLGASQLYEATGDNFYKTFVLEYMEQNVLEDGKIKNYQKGKFNLSDMQCGKSLITVYRWTHEEKYKIAISELAMKLAAQPRTNEGLFIENDEEASLAKILKNLYLAEPFYMGNETFIGKKENYNDIINQFKNVRSLLEPKKMTILDTYNYALALIDTINLTSEQIFEHYKQLECQLKAAIKILLPHGDELNMIAGYVILKSCNQGCLLREKYQYKGEKIVEKYIQKEFPTDKKEIGIYMMAQAQLIKAKKFDY